MAFCSNCAKEISDQAFSCPQCGQPNSARVGSNQAPKNRVTAGVLALLVGGLGIHKFYLNKVGLGIVYIVFCWTFVPAIVAFIEGIIYLTQSDEEFGRRQGVQVI